MAVEVYVPGDGLQGQAIPGHVLWSDEHMDSITIRASPEFTELEAFNADPEREAKSDNSWTFRRFQRPGYLGFVLKTRRIESLDSLAAIELVVSVEGKESTYTKPVRLFRPSLAIDKPPSMITIDTEGRTSDTIRLRHEGRGTLYVTVNTLEDSAVKTVIPEELVHAVKGFAEDFQKGFEELKPKYPNYPQIFEPFTAEELQDRDAVSRRLGTAIEEIRADVDLAADLQSLFTRALLQNADFESMFFAPLLDFFSSIVSGGTILSMPWLEFDIPSGESNLTLVIEAKDVLGAEVVKRTLPPIQIQASQETILPLSKLVAWPRPEIPPQRTQVGPRERGAQRPSERRRR